MKPVGLAITNAKKGEMINYITSGPLTQKDWSGVTGTRKLLAGFVYYLDQIWLAG